MSTLHGSHLVTVRTPSNGYQELRQKHSTIAGGVFAQKMRDTQETKGEGMKTTGENKSKGDRPLPGPSDSPEL